MDHIKALFEGQELSEEFKEKATAIFSAAIKEQESQIREAVESELKESYDSKIEAKIEELEEIAESYITEAIMPKVDQYLTLAVNEWKTENEVALQESAKVTLAESFLTGFVELAESHNLSLPEGELSQISSLQEQVSTLEESIVDLKIKNQELVKEANETQKAILTEKLTESLSEVQKDKITEAIKAVEFKSEEQFTGAVKSIVESYFPVDSTTKKEEPQEYKEPSKETINEQKTYLDHLLSQI